MKLKNKTIAIILILTFLISTIPLSFAEEDVDYSIPSAIMDLTVENNGLLHIKENINYHFDSSANGIYRDIPLKSGQEIKNINITTEGAYNSYEISQEDGKERIKIYLYSDEAKTQKINGNTDVKVNIDYDFTNVIKLYKDTGELQYKLWGDSWESSVNSLTAYIHFPSKEGIQYWINPTNDSASSSWSNNTLKIESGEISPENYLELRSTIPLSEFKNPSYAKTIDSNGLEEIKKIQEENEYKNNIANTAFPILGILMILSVIIPIGIYLKMGREPKINYDGIYEREPPTKDPPALVNSICGVSSNDIGHPDMKGFQATIMDLINRKVLSFTSQEEEINHTNKKIHSNYLKVNEEKISELKHHELEVINTLKLFKINDMISLNKMEELESNRDLAIKFKNNYEKWEFNFKKECIPENDIKKYFISSGSTYMKIYGIIVIILSIIIGYFALDSTVANAYLTLLALVISGIIGIISVILPAKVGGRWTEYGKEYSKKWNNFKKYLKDFSLMKENPPEAIAIWNEYLVYATALGVAKEVYKAMEMTVYKDGVFDDNELYYFHMYGGYYMMNTAFYSGMSTANEHDIDLNDGIGDIGGGSGGGGGGAF